MAEDTEPKWVRSVRDGRTEALAGMQELMDDIRPKVKNFVEQARGVDLHAVAEALLDKLKGLSAELSDTQGTASETSQPKTRITYRNPANKDETYASRGPAPDWFKKLSQGKTPKELKASITNWDDLPEDTKNRKPYDWS